MLLLKHKFTTALFIAFSIIFILQSSLWQPKKPLLSKYHVTNTHATVLALTVILPYLIIWFIALVAYLRMRSYAKVINNTNDGKAFKTIAIGMFCLVLWLPLSAVLGDLAVYIYTAHPRLTPTVVILNNYLGPIIIAPAFILFDVGAKRLLSLVKKPIYTLSQSGTLIYICFSALYVLLTVHDPARAVPTKIVPVATYYEPDWLIIVTLIIPRLIVWYFGLQAVQNIYRYRQQVKGSIYKMALNDLALGIAGAVVISIIVRCIESLPTDADKLNLSIVLIVLYILVLLIGVCSALIARGARKLQKIEEL